MNIAITIILGYFGILIFFTLLTWWAYKRYVKLDKAILPHYPHTTPPSKVDMEMPECSVNVIIIDVDGSMFISFYSYKMGNWIHIHDKFQPKIPFVWMYRPSNFKRYEILR